MFCTFTSAISRYLVSNNMGERGVFDVSVLFTSAISRYLVSNVRISSGHLAALWFTSAISRYLVSNLLVASGWRCTAQFTSAISRYLVSNLPGTFPAVSAYGLHPLYRGTWFPTAADPSEVAGTSIRLHPLYRGTWFPTVRPGHNPLGVLLLFTSAISRYLVSNSRGKTVKCLLRSVFTSAISRYLVSNQDRLMQAITIGSLHPLYRGTWFPTFTCGISSGQLLLGLHPLYRGTWFPTPITKMVALSTMRRFTSAISRYLVSNSKPPVPQR